MYLLETSISQKDHIVGGRVAVMHAVFSSDGHKIVAYELARDDCA
jgi:hypothetical protein